MAAHAQPHTRTTKSDTGPGADVPSSPDNQPPGATANPHSGCSPVEAIPPIGCAPTEVDPQQAQAAQVPGEGGAPTTGEGQEPIANPPRRREGTVSDPDQKPSENRHAAAPELLPQDRLPSLSCGKS